MNRTPRLARSLLLATATATAAVVALAPPAFAAAPMVKTQAPGYFRLMLGQFEVTALSDGTVDLPVDQLLKEPADTTRKAMAAHFLAVPTETSVNAFLVNTGTKLVLVDTGAGALFGPTLGRLVASLKAAGYEPGQVDDVLVTHMHPDHVGGLVAAGQVVFPNATLHLGQADVDALMKAAPPADGKPAEPGPRDMVAPYAAAKHLQPVVADGEIVPGIRAEAAHGHTPGHTVYVVESGGRKLLLVGDLIHVGAVQFAHPEVTISFDSDTKAAAAARAKVFHEAAKEGAWVGAAHLQFPGIGHLKANGAGWDWLPVNWTQNR